MPHEVQIALFWLLVWVALRLLRRNPDSLAARVAFSWQGPYPHEAERKSSYYRRKAFFALGWLVQILSIGAVLAVFAWAVPTLRESETLLLVASFALSIGIGMAALGALLAYVVSLKASVFGPDPQFLVAQESNADESSPPTDA